MHNHRRLLLGLSVTLSLAPVVVNAQLIPDNTLGGENSIVTPIDLLKNRIDGGAIRDSNLFHSFQEFNIDNGKSVYFSNPTAIQNILTRVTGTNPSNIFGKLGVLGDANLFLINPNGIIFGKNASLDIPGSFSATTSPSILFDNGFEFSAENPQGPPLLTVNITPGLQYPRSPQADITNQGNLTVGENLNLLGKNLNLTGSLNAGKDLKLQASDTLQIRENPSGDTQSERATLPFIANAGRDLLLRGNQAIDIFALNHPSSGLFSGGDLILQSSTPIVGDTRYFSGGNFRIEQLDGNLGDLESPNDPIIRASGDVIFNSYTGDSLHILAGGSVNISGNVTITGADGVNGLQETVTLSDGQSLEIDGKNQATLDIRAGTDTTTAEFGTPGVTGSGTFTPVIPSTTGIPSSSDIVIGGNIKVNAADGLVFLTNNYNPNTSLNGGNIKVPGGIDTSSILGDGGRIVIDALGDIGITNAINSSAISNAGNISINTVGNLEISSAITATSSTASGGSISLSSGGTMSVINGASVKTESNNNISGGNSVPEGDINLTANSIFLKNSQISALTVDGKAGNIIVDGTDSINLSNVSSIASQATGEGTAGDLFVTADSIILDNQSNITSGTLSGVSGNILLENLKTLQIKENSLLSATTKDGEAGGITINASDEVKIESNSTIASGAVGAGEAGFLEIITGKLSISNNSEATVSSATIGNAGLILINAEDVHLTNLGKIFAQTVFGAGGDINLQNLKTLELDSGSSISVSTVDGETSGDVTINTTESITLDRLSSLKAEATGKGKAGNIFITTPQLNIDNGALISVSNQGIGNAGELQINSSHVNLDNQAKIFAKTLAERELGDDGGDINLQNLKTLSLDNNSSISASTVNGESGNMTINTTESITLNRGSQIVAEATGNGKAGNVDISTPIFLIDNGAFISVSSQGSGIGGDLKIQGGSVTIDNQSRIVAETPAGSGGEIDLLNIKSLQVSNNSLISASTINGEAGNVTVNARDSIKLENSSQLISEAVGDQGIAGNISIKTNQFTISDNSQTNVSSKGHGIAGTVFIDASDVIVSNESKISATTESGSADDITLSGGDIALENLKTLVLTQNSFINATTTDGEAGNIAVNASDSIQLQSGSKLLSEAIGDGIAGNISIFTNQLRMTDSSQANVSSKGNGSAGTILIDASDVFLSNQSEISATTESGSVDDITLSGGDIALENLKTLVLTQNSFINATTTDGEAGNIAVNARDSIQLESGSKLSSEAIGDGIAGNISIFTNQLRMTDSSQTNVSSKGNGSAGSILIDASDIFLSNKSEISAKTTESGTDGNITLENLNSLELLNSLISASTINGEAGDININTTNSVKLSDNSRIESLAKGSGIAGQLNITTSQLTMNNSEANVSSQGSGDAGFILIKAKNVNITNQGKISATTESGIGGDISLENLNSLSLNNSEISASTIDGQAGNLNINAANSIELVGEGGLSVQSTQGGIAGSITVNTSQFDISDKAQITVSSKLGQAGDLDITADNLFLTQGTLTAETGVGESAEGANITLDIKDLLWMQNESLISAEAFDTANGGNITINNPQGFVIGLKFENSDISANATLGNGGNIDITTQNIFGLVFREQKTSYSDITASSKFGVNGQVTVNQLNVNPASGLVELPSNVDATTQIKSGCSASAGNNFVVSGKGGLPQSPDDLFSGKTTVTELFDLLPTEETSSNIRNENSHVPVENHGNQKNQIVEATGWEVDGDGNVIFVAQVSENTPKNSQLSSVSCENFSTTSKVLKSEVRSQKSRSKK